MIEYVKNNRADFCDVRRLNLKFTNEFFASQYYNALVIAKLDCEICGRKR
jgi:hypothetical protein